nr:phosphoribosyl-ATP diphosphatase [Novosphingobium rosa]
MGATLERLEATIAARRSADPETSYVAKLNAKGLKKIAQKLGEEGVETVIAALAEDDAALTGEAADLIFHLIVLLQARGLGLADVCAVLDQREGIGGLQEKAARGGGPEKAARTQ